MIRWRVFKQPGRMRTTTKLQIAAAVAIGFLLGYVVIPSLVLNGGVDVDEAKVRELVETAERGEGNGVGIEAVEVIKLPERVRDVAIQFTSGEPAEFVVGGRKTRLLSGAIHYFRVVPAYWKDRLLRLKAAGLNTVET